jgi:hypothetical protein
MKRCSWCGKKYSDEYSVCAFDGNPLEPSDSPSRPHGTVSTSKAVTQHTKAAWISGSCVLASMAFFFILGLASELSGGFGVLAILAALTAVKVILFASTIAFIVQGFRVHWGWGLANFLGPVAGIIFFFNNRHEGRVPVYVLIHGLILLLVILVCLIVSKTVA